MSTSKAKATMLYLDVARNLFQWGYVEEARHYWRTVLELDPSKAEALRYLQHTRGRVVPKRVSGLTYSISNHSSKNFRPNSEVLDFSRQQRREIQYSFSRALEGSAEKRARKTQTQPHLQKVIAPQTLLEDD